VISEVINSQKALQTAVQVAVIRVVLKTDYSFRKRSTYLSLLLHLLMLLNSLGKRKSLSIGSIIGRIAHGPFIPRGASTGATDEGSMGIDISILHLIVLSGRMSRGPIFEIRTNRTHVAHLLGLDFKLFGLNEVITTIYSVEIFEEIFMDENEVFVNFKVIHLACFKNHVVQTLIVYVVG
jgi:hypothetical protein